MSDDAASAPIRLAAPSPDGGAMTGGQVTLNIGGEAVAFDIEVPDGPVTLEAMLPVFQALTDAVVARGEARAMEAGARISCKAGCGACCRQAVPVAEAEARALSALVAAMPEPRRSQVRARFAAAELRLEEAALATALDEAPDNEAVTTVALDYFGLGLACPFLQDESCSIHPLRPLRCREHLVTSPAAACAAMTPGAVKGVPLAGSVSRVLYGLERDRTEGGWLLLINALSFTRANPGPAPTRPAREWIEGGLRGLARV